MECKKHTLENEINEIQKDMEQVYFDNQELSEKHQISYLIGMTRAPQCIDQLEKENLHLSDCLKKIKSIIINLEKEISEYDQIKKLMQME